MGGGVARFDQRVVDEADAGLLGGGDVEFVLGNEFDVQTGQQAAHFGELARIAGSQDPAS